MRMRTTFLCILLTVVTHAPQAQAQAFQNLGFEAATAVPIPDDPGGDIYFSQAFPGWMGFVGATQESAAGYNSTFLCCSQVSLWGGPSRPDLAIAGTFSVGLHGARDHNGQLADTAIAQTGLVPAVAQSLLFKAQGVGPFSVALGGQSLPIIPLLTRPNYTLFGADVTGWAGQTSELRFTAVGSPGFNFVVFDAIEFSPEPIPEPSAVTLIATAALVGLHHLRRRAREASNKAE